MLLGALLAFVPWGPGSARCAHGEEPAAQPGAQGPAAGGTPTGMRALDQVFRGQVIALKGKDLSLRYDFSKAEQLNDWRESVPWPVTKETVQGIAWFDERLEVKGSTGARHLAEWTGDVWVTCTLTLDSDKDVGGFITPADEASTYACFGLTERFFHLWDNNPGGQHSILKFDPSFRESGASKDFVGFRYVTRRPPAQALKPGDTLPFGFGIQKGKLGLDVVEFQLRGKDLGKPFKDCRPGFYTTKGRMLVDNVVISGRLADGWVAAEKLELRTLAPLPDPASLAVDPAVKELIEGYRAGKTPAADLVKPLGDAGTPKPARDALAQALGAGPRKAVQSVLDLLYRPDLESRAYGIGVIKTLLGKDYGYSAKAGEEQRSEAIRRLLEDTKKHPTLLDGP